MASFIASHPGMASDVAKSYVRPCCDEVKPKRVAVVLNQFNEGEEQKHVDFVIKDYVIPKSKTTYVDIAFNFDDNSSDIFHAIHGEAIVATPFKLHHYVIRGCVNKFPAALVGREVSNKDKQGLGCDREFGGWTPGNQVLWTPPWAGRAIGITSEIVAFVVNVHYDNQNEEEGVVAKDGFRIYYTPTLRPHALNEISFMTISVNPSLKIPAGKKRFFMTRSCQISVNDGDVSARVPVFMIGYHAHLLGREMYMKLTFQNGSAMDLSSPNWHFDDQTAINVLEQHIEVQTGDHVQATCVFDSTGRPGDTVIGKETTDEMCWAKMSTWGTDAAKCTGHMWMGELADDEAGILTDILHPECRVTKAFDMCSPPRGQAPALGCSSVSLIFGGMPVVAPDCSVEKAPPDWLRPAATTKVIASKPGCVIQDNTSKTSTDLEEASTSSTTLASAGVDASTRSTTLARADLGDASASGTMLAVTRARYLKLSLALTATWVFQALS
jgi:hypothetical protein